MQKNRLTIKQLDNGCIQTEIILIGGISAMEIHPVHLCDSKVLESIKDRKYYQDKKGEWAVTFIDEAHVIHMPTFEKLIESAKIHIFVRDNSDYSGFI